MTISIRTLSYTDSLIVKTHAFTPDQRIWIEVCEEFTGKMFTTQKALTYIAPKFPEYSLSYLYQRLLDVLKFTAAVIDPELGPQVRRLGRHWAI